jgi:DNA invertase Pin-like site-specific DNA recombinase
MNDLKFTTAGDYVADQESEYSDLYYDVEQMFIDGVKAKRIAEILGCNIQSVYRVLEDMGVSDSTEEFDPYETINS